LTRRDTRLKVHCVILSSCERITRALRRSDATRELVVSINEKLDRLIEAEVGEDVGRMLPDGIEAGWELTPEAMAA
jgi:arylsulfatase